MSLIEWPSRDILSSPVLEENAGGLPGITISQTGLVGGIFGAVALPLFADRQRYRLLAVGLLLLSALVTTRIKDSAKKLA